MGNARRRFTTEEVEYFKTIIKGRTRKQIAELMKIKFDYDYSEMNIKSLARKTGLKSDVNSLVYERNKAPIGSEHIECGYITIKVSENEWKYKHKILYEEYYGAVPEGHIIIFMNGNNRDFRKENLRAVTRQQLMILNRKKLLKNSIEATETGLLIADLYLKIKERI